MKLKYLEKACEVLHCTPYNIMAWKPDKKTPQNENHPLSMLRRRNKSSDILSELRTMPLEEIKELLEFINKNKKEEDTS